MDKEKQIDKKPKQRQDYLKFKPFADDLRKAESWCELDGVLNRYQTVKNLSKMGYRKQSGVTDINVGHKVGWISVEERLPEPNVDCLVAAKVGNRMVVDLGSREWCFDYRTMEHSYVWSIMNDWDEGEGCEITHWMPLPEAPKMRKEDEGK